MDNSKNNDFDFDNLKGLWKSSLENDATTDPIFDNHKILTIMQEKTSAAVQKIRRNLLIEILTTMPFIMGCYYFFDAKGFHLPILFWVGLTLITIGYHFFLYLKLQKEAVLTTTIAETITIQHANIQRFIKMYDVASIVGGIVFCVASGRFFYLQYNTVTLIFPILMLLSLSSGYGFYAFARWYVQKIYGQYYTTLKESKKVMTQS